MYSYNNIVEKGEPANKNVIDSALDNVEGSTPVSAQHHIDDGTADCIVVSNILSSEECDALVAACETVGFSFWCQKNHNDSNGEEQCSSDSKAVRVVDTIEADFPRLSKLLYQRISQAAHLVPKIFSSNMENASEVYERELEGTWVPYALSENLLFGRYHPGGHFMPHIDGSTVVDINTRSLYTLLLYLNDCPAGGETFIFSGEQCHVMYLDGEANKYRGLETQRVGAVHPTKGSAAFFYYDLLHEGAPVIEGQKYICRADVLYRRTPPICTGEMDRKAFQVYQEARHAESCGDAMRACELFQQVRKFSKSVAALYQLD